MRQLVPFVVALTLAAFPSPAVSKRGPSCLGKPATLVGTRGDDLLRASSGADVIVARGGDDVILGRGGNDRLCSGEGNDDLVGGPGNDQLLDNDGIDALFGGEGNDRLLAAAEHDLLLGGPGDDLLDGGDAGADHVSYEFSRSPVSVDLQAGIATGEGSDTLVRIENVSGSDLGDLLVGNAESSVAGSNRLIGGLGDDTLSGGGGHTDDLRPGPGDDAVDCDAGAGLSFQDAQGPVQVDLRSGTASGDGNDRILGTCGVLGSRFGDRLEGSDEGDSIGGGSGGDAILGHDGDDRLTAGGDEGDSIDGGAGHDVCEAYGSTQANCEERPGIFIDKSVGGPHFVEPWEGQRLDKRSLTRLRGKVVKAYSDAPPRLEVALRRLTPSGCRWWDGDRLVRHPCHSALWLKPKYEGNEGEGSPWSYRLDRRLPAGIFQVWLNFFYGPPRFEGSADEIADFRLT